MMLPNRRGCSHLGCRLSEGEGDTGLVLSGFDVRGEDAAEGPRQSQRACFETGKESASLPEAIRTTLLQVPVVLFFLKPSAWHLASPGWAGGPPLVRLPQKAL